MKNQIIKAGDLLVLICLHCKRIKDSNGHWRAVPGYKKKFAGRRFSHCLCERCAEKLYGAEPWYDLPDKLIR